ncbi:hypothetical protein HLB44_07980 [Aquincola sp. S2]|uniref:Uncharacterized protein n=1 Tax=Pseudaquabacterium terrae TaxID=2732868 RepID=A0ABX2EE85_9BURK|nr:hypothetical protein [Aquabacterium terrae]NRF66918.1 hypothetical protein [Aquabacterium terrae]
MSRRLCLALMGLSFVSVVPAWAASSTASSTSSAASNLVGSLSGSIRQSSQSSSKGTGVAAGPYRVIEVAALPEQPGTVRIALKPVAGPADDEGFSLLLPQATADAARIGTGDVIDARTRPYGIEFARRDDGRAFFLVLADDWFRELRSNAVAL